MDIKIKTELKRINDTTFRCEVDAGGFFTWCFVTECVGGFPIKATFTFRENCYRIEFECINDNAVWYQKITKNGVLVVDIENQYNSDYKSETYISNWIYKDILKDYPDAFEPAEILLTPKDVVINQIKPLYILGQEYEFSDTGVLWYSGILQGTIDDKFAATRIHKNLNRTTKDWVGFKYIRKWK